MHFGPVGSSFKLWPMGTVIEVFEGRDKKVRNCRLRTVNGEITRPIQRLVPLELDIFK